MGANFKFIVVAVFTAMLLLAPGGPVSAAPKLEGLDESVAALTSKYADKKAELQALREEMRDLERSERTLKKLQSYSNRIFAMRRSMEEMAGEIEKLKLRVTPPTINLQAIPSDIVTGTVVKNREGEAIGSVRYSDLPVKIVPGEPFEVAIEVRKYVSYGDGDWSGDARFIKSMLQLGPVKVHVKKVTAWCEGPRKTYGAVNVRLRFKPERIVFGDYDNQYYYSVEVDTDGAIDSSETDLSQPLFKSRFWLKPGEEGTYDIEAAAQFSVKNDLTHMLASFEEITLERELGDRHMLINAAGGAGYRYRPFVKGEHFFRGALPAFEHPGALAKRPPGCVDRTADFVEMPDLVGLPSSMAKSHLERLELKFSLYPGPPAPDPRDFGKVSSQDPPAGELAEKTDYVKLRIYSEYVNLQSVPEVTGLSSGKAREILREAGLSARMKLGGAAPRPEETGKVFEQNPEAGGSVERGVEVEISVYMPFVDQRKVPGLMGLDTSEAERRVEIAELRPRLIQGAAAPSYDLGGKVSDQDPPADSWVQPNSTVHITFYAPFINEVTLPDLRGNKFYDAKQRLDSIGIVADRRVIANAPTSAQADTVTSLSPGRGARLPRGTIVTVRTYGDYIPPPPPPTPPAPPPRQQQPPPRQPPPQPPARDSNTAQCEQSYQTIAQMAQQDTTGRGFAQAAAMLAIVAGCDPARVNQALTGNAGQTRQPPPDTNRDYHEEERCECRDENGRPYTMMFGQATCDPSRDPVGSRIYSCD